MQIKYYEVSGYTVNCTKLKTEAYRRIYLLIH